MTKATKLKLTTIEMQTKDGKTVALSIEEAKDLHSQLDELFGEKVKYIPSTPIYIDRYPLPYRHPYWYGGAQWQTTAGQLSCTARGESGLAVTYRGDSISG